ncbi:hypothetical protein [Trinickia sp.]|uniref:hypothetical protein n=1 Tax=Trinickia sp. TaxID=2571163 RepID=UPI00122221D2|nr:MAG: hypothetical protein EPN57_27425 [Paraburkholderia sp.]
MGSLTSLGAMATADAEQGIMTAASMKFQTDSANNSLKVSAADAVAKLATSIGNKVSQVSGAAH